MLNRNSSSFPGIEYGYSNCSTIPTNYHYHDNFEIYFLIKGNSECFVKNKTYALSDNTILFIPKGILHKNNYISKNYERFVINFDKDYLDSKMIMKMQKLFSECIYIPENSDFVSKIFFTIKNEFEKNDDLSEKLISCYLIQLISYFIRNKSVYKYNQKDITNPSINRLVNYINSNYNKHITLTSASEMLNVSQAHLSRLFLKNTGFGFKEYLQIIRLQNAKQMLKNSNDSISNIAYSCGFSDSNYFSKTFKNFTGFSPIQYRKNLLYTE